MKKYGSTYLITNKINGKKYVGQSTDVVRRWVSHAKPSKATKSLISKAIVEYGIENFLFEELVSVSSRSELNAQEVQFIDSLNTLHPNGYNQTSGGHKPFFVESVREKMATAKLNKPSKNHIISIIATTLDTNEQQKFESLKDACETLDISRSSVLKCCKYGISRKGYLFCYANQSGSVRTKVLTHAQRLEGESTKVEYNPSTSPRFPQKYVKNKTKIMEMYRNGTSYSQIANTLKLDKSMISYFVHTYGK